jgi:protein phosphatase
MKLNVHGISDRGKVRSENEDALFIDQAHGVFAVADGLGGLPGGAETSMRIVDLLEATFNSIDAGKARVDLADLVIRINHVVTQEGLEAHPTTGSGSTLTIGQIIEGQLLIAHVGDSAIYHLRDETLEQLTIDHTMEQEFINRLGEQARPEMPPEYPHTLTRCVGQNTEIRVDQTKISLRSGDRLLLCTDGLNKVLTARQMQCLLEAKSTPKEIAQSLVDSANASEGPDNITCIAIIIE